MPCFLVAQEGLGASLDNYTPVNGMMLNPSAIVDQKPWLDVHVLGAGVHGTNNFIYVANNTLTKPGALSDLSYNLGRKRVWGQGDAELLGPSASLSLGKHALGLHTAVRGVANVHRFPVVLAVIYANADVSPGDSSLYFTKNMRGKTLLWAEAGLTYGRILHQFDRHLLTGAITLNRLMGLQDNALYVKEARVKVVESQGFLLNPGGKYAYAAPAFNAGGGWSGSIGVTYKRMLDDITSYVPHSRKVSCHTLPYRFRVSVSLIDLGGILMKRNAFYNKFDETENAAEYLQNVGGAGVVDEGGIPRDGDRFFVTTPMAAVVQYDHNFNKGLFFNALWLQRLTPPSFYGPERANLLALTPRYERRWISLSLPITLVNYRAPHVGAALRLATLTVGTEHVIPFIIPSDIYAADIYFHWRIRIYNGRGCKEKKYRGPEGFRFMDIFRRAETSPESCPDW